MRQHIIIELAVKSDLEFARDIFWGISVDLIYVCSFSVKLPPAVLVRFKGFFFFFRGGGWGERGCVETQENLDMQKCKILLFYVYSNSAWLSAAMKWKYEINLLAVTYSLFLSSCTFMVFVCVDIYILWDNEETSSKTKPASNLLLFLTQISSSYISLYTWQDHRGFIFLIFLCMVLDTWNWCFASLERTCRFSCSFCSV